LRGLIATWSLVACFAAFSTEATAQNCWEDVTARPSCVAGWHVLQFRNVCDGSNRAINVCVKWTSGPNAGLVNSLAGSAPGGQVATIPPGLCSNGNLRYTFRADGNIPACP
jgi:hypothetical protein